MATTTDFARHLADEQVAAVRRWGDLVIDTTAGLRRLADGQIDAPTFGREVTQDVVREVVLGIESAARIGLEYSRVVADVIDLGDWPGDSARRTRPTD